MCQLTRSTVCACRLRETGSQNHNSRLVQELSAVAHGLSSAAHEVGRRLRPTQRGPPAHLCHDLTGTDGEPM